MNVTLEFIQELACGNIIATEALIIFMYMLTPLQVRCVFQTGT